MPAALANCDGLERSLMPVCSHILNIHARGKVCTSEADIEPYSLYNRNMARRGIPKQRPAWFLREWMEAVGLKGRGAQTRMMELTGWTKGTMSLLYNDQQDLNSEYLRTAARALNIREHELLMHPDAAMALRRFEETAREVAKADPATNPTGPLKVVSDRPKTGTHN